VISPVSFGSSEPVGSAVQNSDRSVDDKMWTTPVHLDPYVGLINYGWPSTAPKPVNASLQRVIPIVHSCEDD
jgi:hypothetical protein